MEDREVIDRDIAIIGRLTMTSGPRYPVWGPVDAERRDYQCNVDLLKLFAGEEELDLEQLARRAKGDLDFLRIGDLINWGCGHGILERCGWDRWRLVEREMQWQAFGGWNGYALRTRGLTGEHARTAAKILKREAQRQERARKRLLGQLRPVIHSCLNYFCRHAPDHPIDDIPALKRFAIAEYRTVAACRGLIEESLDGMLSEELEDVWEALRSIEIDRGDRDDESPSAEDLEILGSVDI